MKIIFASLLCAVLFFSCGQKSPEMTLEEIAEYKKNAGSGIIEKTACKPWKGGNFKDGTEGGEWLSSVSADPKTFNQYIAERDAESAGIISQTLDSLVNYDTAEKKWFPQAAFFEVETNTEKNTLTVHYTLRENLYWTWYNSDKKVPVTSDDIVFWYNEIAGDPSFQSSGYNNQFVSMPDGTTARIECIKINDRQFDFVFPRIIADPLLSTNMSFCPSFIYKAAKEKNGSEGVKELFNASCNVREIPSMGRWYITEYVPGQRIVYKKNPFYWEKDTQGKTTTYIDTKIFQIVGNPRTEYLLFKQGKAESYSPAPEEIDDVINNQKDSYTVFRSEGESGASLWSFNQNPKNSDKPFYSWFTKKEFRQAMSCLLNRERIITQTYRGLAEPKYSFFPSVNPYYDSAISLKYRFNKESAQNLLSKIGINRDSAGIMRDAAGNEISFDLTISSSSTTANDMAQIVADECASIGITVNVRQVDFQKMIELLTSTYEWQSVFVGLGMNIFPTQGSNVWPSGGNLHLWYPEQKTPATDWEARIDFLYNEGSFTNDFAQAKKIWDEYQSIILEQCPVIYLVGRKNFLALQNKWDISNFFYDNINGAMTERIFLADVQ
ncbi:ABC transporter substrate-binding protein [Treponema sp.]|uniref:ABC transporter substrate-binding protein n=1 Tax=Treponema sp. TaxID=166 RepID=UPI003F05D3AC